MIPQRRPSIIGAQAKIDRAAQHLRALEQLVGAFFAEKPFSLAVEPDAVRSRQIIRLQHTRPVPSTEWALIIGDCVHNMRSSLDYIAWELAGADPSDMTTMFPICDSAKSFASVKSRRLKRLPPEIQTIIEKIQPYHKPDPHTHALWAIQSLDAADKHKLLTLTVALPTAGTTRLPDKGGRYELQTSFEAPFEDGAEIASIHMKPFRPDMDLGLRLVFDVAFSPNLGLGSRKFVINGLTTLLNEASIVVQFFDERFFRS